MLTDRWMSPEDSESALHASGFVTSNNGLHIEYNRPGQLGRLMIHDADHGKGVDKLALERIVSL